MFTLHASSPPSSCPRARTRDDSRNFSEIKELISRSKLSAWVKQKSVAVFRAHRRGRGKNPRLAAGEVHFHEVGAVDSIVDIVGACIALELLGKPRVLAAPVVEGTGWVNCAHGRFPVPAPATLAILGARGIGLTQCDEPHELVTPTGAALLAEFVESFGPMENLVAEKIGFGLGTRENRRGRMCCAPCWANVGVQPKLPKCKTSAAWIRFNTGLGNGPRGGAGNESGRRERGNSRAFVETALAAGALDVFHTPIQMKKNRPRRVAHGFVRRSRRGQIQRNDFARNDAFGVRQTMAERRKLRREFTKVKTPFGEVTLKIGRLNGKGDSGRAGV
jgi:uncharacterized protein (DUF111 family)